MPTSLLSPPNHQRGPVESIYLSGLDGKLRRGRAASEARRPKPIKPPGAICRRLPSKASQLGDISVHFSCRREDDCSVITSRHPTNNKTTKKKRYNFRWHKKKNPQANSAAEKQVTKYTLLPSLGAPAVTFVLVSFICRKSEIGSIT